MTVQELKEELQKLEDQGHSDKPVKYIDHCGEYDEIDLVLCGPIDTFVEVM